jgi:uncharacterized membrane protein HdeD (DUF308 family)
MLEPVLKSSSTVPKAGEMERHRWPRGWSAQLGIALIILGIVALLTMNDPSLVAIMRFGWLVFVSGIVEAAHAFHLRRSDAFFLHLVPAVAGVPIGLLIATHPSAGSLAWILLFASYFTVIGLFHVVSALRLKFPNWPWTVLDGIITLALGTLLWAASPWLAPWFFGLAVGVSLVVRGWSHIMLAIGLHNLRMRDQRQFGVAPEQTELMPR